MCCAADDEADRQHLAMLDSILSVRIPFWAKASLGMLVCALTPAYCVWTLAQAQKEGRLVKPNTRERLERSFRER